MTDLAATAARVQRDVAAVTDYLAEGMESLGLEVSRKKGRIIASSRAVGAAVAASLRRWGFSYVDRVKGLGAAMGAGVRRNAKVARQRLAKFIKRRARFRRLRAAGVRIARLINTGGNAYLSHGQADTGVATSLLYDQRRAVAATIAASGVGKDLDLVFAVEESHARELVDPAYPAHEAPIGEWADAVWHQWLPRRLLQRMTAAAKVTLAKTARPWSAVFGPAAVFVASAARLGWAVHDAVHVTSDCGRELNLVLDPPIVIRRCVREAVRR